jgi:mannose-6-phosphate isomerase-like protein (cupin superfamily)
MGTIKFVRGDEQKFVSVEDRAMADPRVAELLKKRGRDSFPPVENFVHHEGSEDEPELIAVRLPADFKVEAHAHLEDEIIVVSEGEVIFGKQAFGVGSSVFIPKMTLYGFQAGPEGLTFLNFRPTRSPGLLTKEDLMAKRKGASE